MNDNLKKASEYMHVGDLESAQEQYTEVLKSNPDNVEALMSMGIISSAMKNYSNAIVYFNTAIKSDPQNPDIISNLGHVLDKKGLTDKAKICFRHAIAIKPDHKDALNNMGFVLTEEKQYDEAIEYFTRTLSIYPDDSAAQYGIGNCIRDTKQIAEAYNCYRALIDKDKTYYKAIHEVGSILSKNGSLAEANVFFRQALAIEPYFMPSLHNLASNLFFMLEYNEFDVLLEDIKNSKRLSKIEMSGFYIFKMIRAYIDDILTKTENKYILKNAQFITNPDIIESDIPDSKNHLIYFTYILLLLKYRNENSELYEKSGDKTLYILGESHTLSPANITVEIDGAPHKCLSKIVVGVKAWHLCWEENTRQKNCFMSHIERLPNSSKVVVMIGEIDCRPNEGILHRFRNSDSSIDKIIEETVSGYVRFVCNAAKTKNLEIIFYGIPAYNADVSYMKQEDILDVYYIIENYNKVLEHKAREAKCRFIDIYQLTKTSEGHAIGEQHLDSTHVYPHIFSEAISNIKSL